MKTFARWLFMKCYHAELVTLAKDLRKLRDVPSVPPSDQFATLRGMGQSGRAIGMIDVLERLELVKE